MKVVVVEASADITDHASKKQMSRGGEEVITVHTAVVSLEYPQQGGITPLGVMEHARTPLPA